MRVLLEIRARPCLLTAAVDRRRYR
eukprot:SAG11_NODE_26487_length_344_cov_1.248980_1_plen_24_part_01